MVLNSVLKREERRKVEEAEGKVWKLDGLVG
jgi:hypothetical protein